MTVQDAAQPGQTQRILVQGDPSSGNGIMATFYLGRNASGSKPAADTAKQYKLDLPGSVDTFVHTAKTLTQVAAPDVRGPRAGK